MTNEEFSNEFDILLNSFASTESFGNISDPLKFDEYEKSLFLTKAQEELVVNIYNGKAFGYSFEETEEIRRYLSNMIKTDKISDRITGYKGLSTESVFFKLPEDVLFITYEAVVLQDENLGCANGETISVIPITQDEYHRIIKNPFRGVSERRALRLDLNDEVVEIISKYNIESYLIRYLSRPSPIILINLVDNLSINGVNTKTECGLNPIIHRAILERAVNLAIASKLPSSSK